MTFRDSDILDFLGELEICQFLPGENDRISEEEDIDSIILNPALRCLWSSKYFY